MCERGVGSCFRASGAVAKMHDFEMDGIGKRSQMRWKDTEETNTSRAAEKMLLKSELLMKSVKLLGR